MRPGQASRTAEFAAAFRALESVRRPARSRLFEDRFAIHFLPPKMQRTVRMAGLPLLGPILRYYVDRRWPGAMTSGIARTRLIDDWLSEGLREGIRQVVLLGAGYDSRALRMPELADCRVFEVDHPSTQAAKRDRLASIYGAMPAHVAYVAADLTSENLYDVLDSSGLDRGERAFVIWEGVTHYIGGAAVERTLRAIARCLASGSRVLFTYLHKGLVDGTESFDGALASRDRVSSEGEPWIFGMLPTRLPDYLAGLGMTLIEDIGAVDYRGRYWGDRGRRMRGFAFYRVAMARVG